MRTGDAVTTLQALIDQNGLGEEPLYLEWQAKGEAVLRSVFGPDAEITDAFQRASAVKKEPYTTAGGLLRDLQMWRSDAAARAKGVLRAAIFTLETVSDGSPLDDAAIEGELWAHVQGLVATDDWAKVPAAVAIFVEDKVRTWAGDPRQDSGAALVGKALYAKALNDAGTLRLGRQESEWEGWRSLGVGLALACGNVDRHRIQQRADVKRYAMGVLGLGSLLLTQLRYEHAARIAEEEAGVSSEN